MTEEGEGLLCGVVYIGVVIWNDDADSALDDMGEDVSSKWFWIYSGFVVLFFDDEDGVPNKTRFLFLTINGFDL